MRPASAPRGPPQAGSSDSVLPAVRVPPSGSGALAFTRLSSPTFLCNEGLLQPRPACELSPSDLCRPLQSGCSPHDRAEQARCPRARARCSFSLPYYSKHIPELLRPCDTSASQFHRLARAQGSWFTSFTLSFPSRAGGC